MFPRYYPNTVQNIHEMIKWASLLIWFIAVPAIMAQQHNYQVRRQLKTEKVKKNLKPEIQRLDSVVGFIMTPSLVLTTRFICLTTITVDGRQILTVVRLILPGELLPTGNCIHITGTGQRQLIFTKNGLQGHGAMSCSPDTIIPLKAT